MTARPGLWPRAVSAAARSATSARIFFARALPSMMLAVMCVLESTKAARRRPLYRGGVLCLGLRAEGDLQEIGDGVGVELFHDVGAVRLDRLDADAEVVGNLLVQAPCDDALEHLRLARGQARQQRVAAGGFLMLRERGACLVEHALHEAEQLFFLERLLDEIHRAFFH